MMSKMPSLFTYFKRKRRDESSNEKEVRSQTSQSDCESLSTTDMMTSPSNVIDSTSSLMSIDFETSMDNDICVSSNDHRGKELETEGEREDVASASSSSTSSCHVSSITSTATTTFFENKKEPHRPHLKSYPKKKQGKANRSFNPEWYRNYSWLEYFEELDACFCFPCRVLLTNSKEKVFTRTGFSDWKHALSTGKGIIGHNGSKGHENAMALWQERNLREKEKSRQIQNQVLSVTSEHKKWIFAVFNVVRFLSANGLPFRGDTEHDIDSGDGLFIRAFSQLIFNLDPNLKDIYNRLPRNAKYVSPDIQNEMISIMTKLVKSNVASKVRTAGLFTIMADGTSDKNRNEIQGLVLRYWCKTSGRVEEHCLDIKGVDDRSAKGVFEFIKAAFSEFDLSFDGLVSQSYDGASVMSGEYNGLQRLISDNCERFVLYIHCFLHKINLVVVHVMTNISEIKEYFEIITSLYKFFKKSAVIEVYEGSALKRLIATRWSGHHDSTMHINNNYGQVIEALRIASINRKLKSDDRALALGLLQQTNVDKEFFFVNCMLMEVLKPINIVVKQLQSPGESLSSALTVVNSTRNQLTCIRENLSDEKVDKMVKEFLNEARFEEQRPDRSKKLPPKFNEFLVTEHIPSENQSRSHVAVFTECLDFIEQEFSRRFSTENIQLWKAMETLSPDSDSFLDSKVLTPLFEYAQSIPLIQNHIVGFGQMLSV